MQITTPIFSSRAASPFGTEASSVITWFPPSGKIPSRSSHTPTMTISQSTSEAGDDPSSTRKTEGPHEACLEYEPSPFDKKILFAKLFDTIPSSRKASGHSYFLRTRMNSTYKLTSKCKSIEDIFNRGSPTSF